ncbi:MAG TPA: GYD domain-containing protein [Nitrososphaeraceae archaeon]|nr:GYD domain-containing protein [Nitrososphaeraceae archaeon]
MRKYVLLLNWTDQGIRNVKDTIKRAESFRSYLEKRGGKLSDILYTFGQYDIVAIAELPNDEIAMSVSLGTGALGNVRVTTLKAFNLDETRRIVDELK